MILPEENRKDYSDLPDFITEGIEVHFVSEYQQVSLTFNFKIFGHLVKKICLLI
jgi:ATP-dependent Lon protease